MKKMTCKELGGACDKVFQANTFDEIAEISKEHGMKMFQLQDATHLDAMGEMQELMQNTEAMKAWVVSKKKEFDAKPNS